jgi:hypothetical protein
MYVPEGYTLDPELTPLTVSDIKNIQSRNEIEIKINELLSKKHKIWVVVASKNEDASGYEMHYLSLFGKNSYFKIVNRNGLEPVLSELKLSQSGLLDNYEPLKLSGATHIIYYDLKYCKLIDIENGSIIATHFNAPHN